MLRLNHCWTAVFALLLVAACGGGPSSPTCASAGQACSAGVPCCGDLSCAANRCELACSEQTPCARGLSAGGCCGAFPYCVATAGGIKRCSRVCGADGATCGVDGDCCSGACRQGRCVDLTVELVQLGQPCGVASQCGDPTLECRRFREAVVGFCTRSCAESPDCGPRARCDAEICVRPCPDAACGTGALCWSLGVCFPDCRSTNADVCGTRQACSASGECVPTGCTRQGGSCEQAAECCSSAPFCHGIGSTSKSCETRCGIQGLFCSVNADCCPPLGCAFGRCQELCEAQACTAGFVRGGCCPTAPYCVGLAGARQCASQCAPLGSGCAAATDCCNARPCIGGVCS